MSDMQCPYCEADQTVNHDDGFGYEEGPLHEHKCRACGKTFVFQTFISLSYEAFTADCLNGGEHKLKFRKSWPAQYSRMGCVDCDFERTATADEIKAEQPA